jgi:hypothetical protein
MKKILNLFAGGLIGGIIALLILGLLSCISWIAVCGVIKLITICFGWTFDWLIATGIWFIMILAKSIFSHNTTVKK